MLSMPMIILNKVVLPAPFGPMTPTIPFGGSMKFKSSNSNLSPNAFATCCASITLLPKRGPFGMKISSLASRSFWSSFKRASYEFRRALPLA